MKPFIIMLLLVLTFSHCKKEKIENNQNTKDTTPKGIKPESKEYVYFEIDGLTDLTSYLFQDADGYVFKGYHDKCPISPTYVLFSIQKAIEPYKNPQFSIFLGTDKQPTKFKDGVKIQDYQIKDLSNNNAAITFSHNRVNIGGLGSSTMNGTQGNEFSIYKIETINNIEYAFGKFKIYMHTPAPGNKEYYWIKNGQFKIKI